MNSYSEDTSYAVQTLLYRNALGRDIGSSFEPMAKAVDAATVRDLFSALDACKAEFVVR